MPRPCPRVWSIFGIFIPTYPGENVSPSWTQPMSLPQSYCVFMPSFRSLESKGFLKHLWGGGGGGGVHFFSVTSSPENI